MTDHVCPKCGVSIDPDPSPLVNMIRVWLWRQAHKLNCGKD